jgi:hypothetical protein
MSFRLACSHLFVAVLVAASGCAGPSHPQATAPSAPVKAPNASNFEWYPAVEGNLAVRLNVSAFARTSCTTSVNASYESAWHGPALARLIKAGGKIVLDDLTGSQRGIESGARVQAGGAEQSHYVGGSQRRIAFGYDFKLDVDPAVGPTSVFFAARDLRVFNGQPSYGDRGGFQNSSLAFRLRCEGPVSVGEFEVSRGVAFFNEMGMKEGASVHADPVFDPAGATVLGVARLAVAEPRGLMMLYAGGDLLGNRLAAGVIKLTYPGGSDLWFQRPGQVIVECGVANLCKPDDFRRVIQAGSGTYEVQLTYASVELMGRVNGVLAGLASVAGLDAVK